MKRVPDISMRWEIFNFLWLSILIAVAKQLERTGLCDLLSYFLLLPLLFFFFVYVRFILCSFCFSTSQVGHGDGSDGHDGLSIPGAQPHHEGHDSLTTNGPLLPRRGMMDRNKAKKDVSFLLVFEFHVWRLKKKEEGEWRPLDDPNGVTVGKTEGSECTKEGKSGTTADVPFGIYINKRNKQTLVKHLCRISTLKIDY